MRNRIDTKLKNPRMEAMYELYRGYVYKRNTPISPPPMQKVYSVLWGTLLLDYDSEEDFMTSLSPKSAMEVLGVSEWDGKGRANNYPGGFLLVTHTGGTYYVSVSSAEERDEWILSLRQSLECVFANPDVTPFKPSKIIQNRLAPENNQHCPVTRQPLNGFGTLCKCCGRCFSSADYVSEPCTLLQLGSEGLEKVCGDCKASQMCILWLKTLNYVHTMDLHELTPSVLRDVYKYKASFKIRRRQSQSLDMAAALYDEGNLTAEEFEELRQVYHAHRREMQYEECRNLRMAVDAMGEDIQIIFGILLDSNMTDKGGVMSYKKVVERILELADEAPDLIDFYFPQLFQVHLLQASERSPRSLRKVDILQQALLVLAQKYPALGLKLAWTLIAVIGDYHEKKANQVQFAACACLLMQLEMVVTGIVSAIADVPNSNLLRHIMRPALHQQQEIGFEISALFLIRRQLQEAYDEEERGCRERNKVLKRAEDSNQLTKIESLTVASNKAPIPVFPGSNKCLSCLELMYSLGVGQQDKKGRESESSVVSLSNGPQEEEQGTFHIWESFGEQLDFVNAVNELVDSLRFVDRPLRSDMLKKELSKWNHFFGKKQGHRQPAPSFPKDTSLIPHHENHNHHHHPFINPFGFLLPHRKLGWDPIRIAGEPHYRIINIVIDECRVFKTKARAPSMIVCEVMRDDLYCRLQEHFQTHKESILHHYKKMTSSATPEQKSTAQEIVLYEPQEKGESETSSSHSANGENSLVSSTGLQESPHDNESPLESSPPPSLAEPQGVPENKQIQTDEVLSISEKAEKQGESYQLTIPRAGLVRHGSLSHIPKARGSSILPASRFSPSTEGILRTSTATNKFGYEKEEELFVTDLKPPRPLSHKTVLAIEGKSPLGSIAKSVSTPNFAVKHDLTVVPAGVYSHEIAGAGLDLGHINISDRLQSSGTSKVGINKHKVSSSAHKLLQEGIIDEKEYEKLLLSDMQYREVQDKEEALLAKIRVEKALGETFASKKERILGERMKFLRDYFLDLVTPGISCTPSEQDCWPACDLRAFIVKTNDDLRQEICCLQLMQICKVIFEHVGLGSMLYLKPYRIACTGSSSGVVEVLTDAISLDALKRTEGFTSLSHYFNKTYGISPERLSTAKRNFMASLAAYSLFSYLLQIKDRHNGNLLIDSEGHIIHIDFGFILSIAPGGSFSIETAPFKLTDEMVELLGGLDSQLFGEFVTAFTKGFIALQKNCESILSAITVLSRQSTFPCFQNKSTQEILEKLKARFRSELSVQDVSKHCLDLITNSFGHYGTSRYDRFQYLTNGILM